MAVPKRKHSKSRSRIDRHGRNLDKKVTQGVPTKDGKGVKRAHVEEVLKI